MDEAEAAPPPQADQPEPSVEGPTQNDAAAAASDGAAESDASADDAAAPAPDSLVSGLLSLSPVPHPGADAGEAEEDATPSARAGRESDAAEELLRISSARVQRRPTSAQVAALIEGYDDDFTDPEEAAEQRERTAARPSGRLSEDSAIANALLPTPTDATRRLAAAEADRAALLATNERLQRHIRGVLDLRHKANGGGENQLGTAEARYAALRQRLVEHRAMLEATSRHYDRTIDDLRETLQTRLNRTTAIQNALRHFIVEVGKAAECPRTGKQLAAARVERLMRHDLAKEEALIVLRLKNIELNAKMARLEATVRQKEELAQGLHLIDFEQLKIENQALTEKIEERSEELLKLRRKITTTAQILTHTREKQQFVKKKNARLAGEVAAFDAQLGSQRDALSKVKQRRDKLRAQAARLKEGSAYVDNPMLLADMRQQRALREELAADIDDLQERRNTTMAHVAGMTHQIMAASQDVAIASR